jgi:polyketide biosynthesis acyl carrier protein
MDREHALRVVVKHLRLNVDGVAEGDVDPARSMADYGASSLDIIEVVSASVRELRVRVPMTRLAGLRNIGELADVLARSHGEMEAERT